MDEYYCSNCGACLNDQVGFDPSVGVWICTSCRMRMMDEDIYNGDTYKGVAWYCDECGALLNKQYGFSDQNDTWNCVVCGHENSITEDDIVNSQADDEANTLASSIISSFIANQERKKRKKDFEEIIWYLSKLQQVEDRKENRETLRKHWKGICLTLFITIFLIISLFGYLEYRKLTPIGISSDNLIGEEYNNVIAKLQTFGFTNIQTLPQEDLDFIDKEKENQVFSIEILGKNNFQAESKFPYDTKITVRYHELKKIKPPCTNKEAKNMYFTDVVDQFKKAGFVNIQIIEDKDVVLGWFAKHGDVEEISIDGDKKYATSTYYRPDVKIVITYHTYKSNNE